MSATCGNKAAGHKDAATASNTMGGSDLDKGWNTRCLTVWEGEFSCRTPQPIMVGMIG
jgi:hypothetical protein